MSEATDTAAVHTHGTGGVPGPSTLSGEQSATHASSRSPWLRAARWEGALVVLLVAVLVLGAAESSTFLSSNTLFFGALNMGEIAIMALPMLLIIMIGQIDLSVASMLGLSGAVMGDLYQTQHSITLAIVAALAVGILGGSLNGLLVARGGLPSIAVTIGTLTLFRGLAEVTLTNPTTAAFPTSLTTVGVKPLGDTHLSYSFVIFLALAICTGVVLHATPLGRSLYAIGLQPEAAEFAGIRVRRITFLLYVLSGLLCALAGVLFTLKNASASYGAGTGLELTVVAVVLLGGVSIFGGKGTVVGVVLSIVIVGALQQVLTQLGVKAEIQNIVTGGLLLLSVLVPNGPGAFRRATSRLHRPATSTAQ